MSAEDGVTAIRSVRALPPADIKEEASTWAPCCPGCSAANGDEGLWARGRSLWFCSVTLVLLADRRSR